VEANAAEKEIAAIIRKKIMSFDFFIDDLTVLEMVYISCTLAGTNVTNKQ
jgi:hypothetical protein